MSKKTSPTFALLVGINDYSALDRSLGRPQGTSDLQGAVNDLRSMAMLTRMMDVPAENIRVLSAPKVDPNTFAAVAMGRNPPINMNMADATTGFATRDELLAGLRWLADKLCQNPGAQGIFYYSGHSFVTRDGHPCFCPLDTYRGAPTTERSAELGEWFAVSAYLLRGLLAKALLALVGGEEQIPAAWAALQDSAGLPIRERAEAAVQAVGRPVVAEDIARFASALGELLLDPALGPGEAQAELLLALIADWGGLSAEILRNTLHRDAFADDPALRNLVSFNEAFVGIFRDVPQSCAFTAVLETCLQPPEGVGMHSHYAGAGIPFAIGGQVLLASCALGQTSNLAVFDNQWHGAFTWGLVSVLSQRTVRVNRQGRSFDLSNGSLCTRIGRLIAQLGFGDQQPVLWSQHAQAKWPVFGRPGWTKRGELPPVRLKEEIDAGSSGHIFEILASGAADHLGWLVCTTSGFSANGLNWAAGKDYWLWDGVENVMPSVSFRLVPAPVGKVDDPLPDLIVANNVTWPSGKTRVYSSQAFQGSATGSVTLSGFYKVKKGAETLGVLSKGSGDALSWRRCQSGPAKLVFTAAGNRKMAAGEVVDFAWVSGAESVSTYGDALAESPD